MQLAPEAPKHAGGRPRKWQTVEELQAGIDKYFEAQHGKPLTMAGLARALDCDRHTLLNYSNENSDRPEFASAEFVAAIKRARRRVEEWVEEELFGNRPVGPIFWLKNNAGWKDQQNVTVTGNVALVGKVIHEHLEPGRIQEQVIEGSVIQSEQKALSPSVRTSADFRPAVTEANPGGETPAK